MSLKQEDKFYIIEKLIEFNHLIYELSSTLMVNNSVKEKSLFYLMNSKILKTGTFIYKNININYRLHGAGCEFIFNNKIIDFDIVPFNSQLNIYPKFSLWKFMRFLKSFDRDIKEECLDFFLNDLNVIGLLDYKKGLYEIKSTPAGASMFE